MLNTQDPTQRPLHVSHRLKMVKYTLTLPQEGRHKYIPKSNTMHINIHATLAQHSGIIISHTHTCTLHPYTLEYVILLHQNSLHLASDLCCVHCIMFFFLNKLSLNYAIAVIYNYVILCQR